MGLKTSYRTIEIVVFEKSEFELQTNDSRISKEGGSVLQRGGGDYSKNISSSIEDLLKSP